MPLRKRRGTAFQIETKGLGYGYERHLHRQLLPHRSGSFGGGLKDASAVEMCAAVVKEALYRASAAPEQVDEVIFGGVLTAGLDQNVARQAAVKAGVPYRGFPNAVQSAWLYQAQRLSTAERWSGYLNDSWPKQFFRNVCRHDLDSVYRRNVVQ